MRTLKNGFSIHDAQTVSYQQHVTKHPCEITIELNQNDLVDPAYDELRYQPSQDLNER